MPTYEYRCLKCDRRFEVFQSMTDQPVQECRFCGGAVKRLPGAGAGLIFKGSGFYCTDYRSGSYRQQASKDTVAVPPTTSSTSSSKSSESKPSSESKAKKGD